MKWPTLQDRLNQPIASRCNALKQMKANGDVLSPLAERYLEKCLEKEKKKVKYIKPHKWRYDCRCKLCWVMENY
jgi:hypothetical protein